MRLVSQCSTTLDTAKSLTCVRCLWTEGKQVVAPDLRWNPGVLGVVPKYACKEVLKSVKQQA